MTESEIWKTEAIFKTEGFPEHTFIQPPDFANIVVDIRSPQKPVVFEGASGTGKTSAVIGAINQAGIPKSKISLLSARSPEDVNAITKIVATRNLNGFVTIVDDFHRLPEDLQTPISDMMRLMAERPEDLNGKLIVAGINQVGHKLISVSEDLLKRISIHRIKPAEKKSAIESLTRGAEMLRVTFLNLEEIFEEAKGDYWTLQKLCQQAALDTGVYNTAPTRTDVFADIQNLRSKIVEQLGHQFQPLVRDFVRGVRFRRTNQAYLHFLKAFSTQPGSSLSLEELSVRVPSEKARLDQIKTRRLPELFRRKRDISKKFFYDQSTTTFSIEDPGLNYYVKNIDWNKVATDAGFPAVVENFDFEVGISFAGEQRTFAREIADSLMEDDISVFYDEYADLWGKNLEDALQDAYGKKCKYVVVLITEEYKKKTWTSFERAVWNPRVQSGAILPVFIDDVIIKEVSTSMGRIDFRHWRDRESKTIDEATWKGHFEILIERICRVLESR